MIALYPQAESTGAIKDARLLLNATEIIKQKLEVVRFYVDIVEIAFFLDMMFSTARGT